MKTIFKALAISLVVFMMMTITTFAAAPFSDVEGADCEQAVTVLHTLGLLEGKTDDMFAPFVNMTRGELATVIMRFMNLERETGSGTVFTDVADYHWACGNIEAAYGMGIINGMGDGTFAPDANVTFAQAIKMFVASLGYSVHAEAEGGYPSGYMSKAAQLGMLKGVAVAGADTPITRSDMAVIMYNMLDIDLLVETSYGAGASGGYAEVEGRTLISEYRGIYKVEGMVTADYYTAIKASNGKVDKGEIAIDGEIFTEGITKAGKFLGYKVEAYYKEIDETGANEIIYVAPVQGTNSITISAADIDEEEITTTSIEYTDAEGKAKSFAIDNGATLVLNGVVKDSWSVADLMPVMGTVTAIDNRGANDVILVDAYTNYVVKSKNANKNMVYFKEAVNGTSEIELDFKDTAKKISLKNSKGEEIGIDALTEWDILSIAKSANGVVIKVVKSSDRITGKVTESDSEEVVINDVAYNVDPSLPNGSLQAPTLNMSAAFCLDFMGSIAAVDSASVKSFKYGYLVGAAYKKGIDGTAQFKVFTEDGQMVLFDTEERVIVNNDTYKATEVIDYIPTEYVYGPGALSGTTMIYRSTDETIRQLIRYTANTETNVITEIQTANNALENPTDTAGTAGFNKVLKLAANGASMSALGASGATMTSANAHNRWDGQVVYNGGGMSGFAGTYGVGGNTKIFIIPDEDAADDQYKMKREAVHHDMYPGASFYDLSETYVLGAIVWDQGQATKMGASIAGEAEYTKYPLGTDPERYYGIVIGTVKSLDEEGEEVTKITLLQHDKKVVDVLMADKMFRIGTWSANTNLTKDTDLSNLSGQNRAAAAPLNNFFINANQLKYGDVLHYTYNLDKTAFDACEVVYRANTPGMYETGHTDGRLSATSKDTFYTGGDMTSGGTVVKATSKSLILKSRLGPVSASGTVGNEIIRTVSTTTQQGAMTIVMDLDAQTYEIASYDDVVDGDTYAMIWTTIWPRFFIVYR